MPFHASAFKICGISRPRSAPGIVQICRPGVLSLQPSYLKLPQDPWRPARNVGIRYSRFICWIILAADGSKCIQGHRFLRKKNHTDPPEELELPSILDRCVKIHQIDWTQASVDIRSMSQNCWKSVGPKWKAAYYRSLISYFYFVGRGMQQ